MAIPNQLAVISITNKKTPAEIRAAKSPFLRQFGGSVPKGTVLPHTQVQACPRVRVADLPEGHLKQKHIEHLEQNQLIASCCRHPENHDVEALKSHPEEEAPNIYIFHCTCGRKHRFFCVGETDPHRPTWGAE
jgi:hypothetical protein